MYKNQEEILEVIKEESKAKPDAQSNLTKNRKSKKSVSLINQEAEGKKKITIRGLSTNSQEVKKGYIFFAVKGNNNNGEKYIKDAVNKGASTIVCSNKCKYRNKKVTIIKKKKYKKFY